MQILGLSSTGSVLKHEEQGRESHGGSLKVGTKRKGGSDKSRETHCTLPRQWLSEILESMGHSSVASGSIRVRPKTMFSVDDAKYMNMPEPEGGQS